MPANVLMPFAFMAGMQSSRPSSTTRAKKKISSRSLAIAPQRNGSEPEGWTTDLHFEPQCLRRAAGQQSPGK
eukprot:3738403-Pyramimonas_sp.AAC.1